MHTWVLYNKKSKAYFIICSVTIDTSTYIYEGVTIVEALSYEAVILNAGW